MKLEFRQLDSKKEMMQSFSLLTQFYKNLSQEEFDLALDEMIASSGYKMAAAYLDEKLVGVSGFWIARMIYCGRYLQASNLVVDENFRSLGIGKKLLGYLEEICRKHQCNKFVLDSHTENKKSHPLYFECDFYIRGFHFMKDMKKEPM